MSDAGTTPPSPRAVQRLASDVGGEVAGLRASLRRALDDADRFEADGRPDRAAAVLAEQQELLAAVHRRLEDRLAEAAVEREAEGVVDAASPVASTARGSARDAVVTPPGRGGEGMALRLLASAAAAAFGVLLLVVPDAGGMLTVAGWSAVEGDEAEVQRPDGEQGPQPEVVAPRSARDLSAPGEAIRPRLEDLAIPEAADLQRRASDDAGAPPQDDPTPWLPGAALDAVEDVTDELEDAAASTLGRDGSSDEQAQDGAGTATDPPSDEPGAAASSPDGAAEDSSSESADEPAGRESPAAEDGTSDDASSATDDDEDDEASGGTSTAVGFEELDATDAEGPGAGR